MLILYIKYYDDPYALIEDTHTSNRFMLLHTVHKGSEQTHFEKNSQNNSSRTVQTQVFRDRYKRTKQYAGRAYGY